MSSTGVVSKTFIMPTNAHTESQRSLGQSIGAIPPHENQKKAIGVIREVHEARPRLVKAYSLTDGTPIANGSWIELNHSAQEVAERWGTVRQGFIIRVSFAGPSGAGADATIIGAEQEDVNEAPYDNDAQRGLFAIFSPGIGIG